MTIGLIAADKQDFYLADLDVDSWNHFDRSIDGVERCEDISLKTNLYLRALRWRRSKNVERTN